MIIHIVAGGPKEYIPDLSIYKEDKNIKWIAVDRGALYYKNSASLLMKQSVILIQ